MRQTFVITIGIFMFLLTTTMMIMLPMAVNESFNTEQRVFIASMGILGYLTSFIYIMTYIDNKKLKQ